MKKKSNIYTGLFEVGLISSGTLGESLLYGLIIVEKVAFVNELSLIIHAQNDLVN